MQEALQCFLGVERAEFQLPEGVLLMIHALPWRERGREGLALLASLLPAYSLCRRALLATHHDEAGGLPVLVRGVRVRVV